MKSAGVYYEKQLMRLGSTLFNRAAGCSVRKRAGYVRDFTRLNIGALKAGDPLKLCFINPAFEIANAHFYQVRNERWQFQPGMDPDILPFVTGMPGGDIVPLAGGIYIGNRRLRDKELIQAGLHPIKNSWGLKTTFPFFAKSDTRVIMYPDLHQFSFLSNLFNAISFQFKGAGGQYHGRVVWLNPGGWLTLKPREKLLSCHDEPEGFMGPRKWVGYPELLGKFGIFLDSIHQPPPSTPDPVGAILANDTRAMETDELLLKNGATLAALSIASIRILRQEEIVKKLGLKDYESGDLFILCRALLTDTRRLYSLFDPEHYQYYIEQDYGPDFVKGRQQHLQELVHNMAKNMRAILLAKLALKPQFHKERQLRPNTFLNFDPCGAMYDTAELSPTQDMGRIEQTIIFWLDDIYNVMKASGLDLPDYFLGSGLIENIFATIFGRDYDLAPIRSKIHMHLEFNTPLLDIIKSLSKKIVKDWERFKP